MGGEHSEVFNAPCRNLFFNKLLSRATSQHRRHTFVEFPLHHRYQSSVVGCQRWIPLLVARAGYAAELGLGLKSSIDYSDYSLEHMKKNHGERPWTGSIYRRECPEDAPLIPPDSSGNCIQATVDPPVQFPTSLAVDQAGQFSPRNITREAYTNRICRAICQANSSKILGCNGHTKKTLYDDLASESHRLTNLYFSPRWRKIKSWRSPNGPSTDSLAGLPSSSAHTSFLRYDHSYLMPVLQC